MEELALTLDGHWLWALPTPTTVITVNAFGHVLALGRDRSLWRVCPERLAVTRLADDAQAGRSLLADARFQDEWQMHDEVARAQAALGLPPDGHCYTLRVAACSGGEYAPDNLRTMPLLRLLELAGDLAGKVRHLPNWTPESW